MEQRCYGCMRIKSNSPICEHCGYDERRENSNHQLPVGTVVGEQYILGKVLGQGGFGITYIGYDRTMDQTVAVKEYFPSGYAGRDTRDPTRVTSYDTADVHAFETNMGRFLREAESLAKLWNIPQIVRVLRHFEENGTAYIAMEYVEGMDLRHYMKRMGRPMNVDEVMDTLGPVIQALSYVHKAALVHRDISPDNIMVMPDGNVKLLDFGAARYVENADAEKDRNTSTQAILKHGFAPPEQYRTHGALGPWTDVYALCATVYFCMTGKLPPEAMGRLIEDTELGWEKIPGLTRRQIQALDKGMALKPKDRIQSVEELYRELFGEILEAREAARKAAEAEKRRAEEARKAEAARKAEEARLAEEARRKEQARKEAEEQKKAAAEEKERLRQEARQRRLEEKQKKQHARKRRQGKPVLLIAAAAAVLTAVVSLSFLKRPADPAVNVPQTEPVPADSAASVPLTEPVPAVETVMTVPETESMDWQQNVLMGQTTTSEGSFDLWYEQNRNNSAFTNIGGAYGRTYYRNLSNGEVVRVNAEGMADYYGSVPVFNTDILKKEVVEIIFLDTLADAPENAWDVSEAQDGSVQAWAVPDGKGMYILTLAADGGICAADACGSLFYGFSGLKHIRFNNAFHTEGATSMYGMFFFCLSLEGDLDLSALDTSQVTSMSQMFHFCYVLQSVDLSSFDTSNVTNMRSMFDNCPGLSKLDLRHFDTSNVTDMSYMFSGCSGLTELELRGFRTSEVTDMTLMFNNCVQLTELNLDHFDTSNVTSMSEMFHNCRQLTQLDLSGFDVSKVTNMKWMFSGCSGLRELQVGSWAIRSDCDREGMFDRCDNLPASMKAAAGG